jgi:hypothetical protein
MADPFTVGTGLVGVIGVALQLTEKLKDYASGWKEAPATIENLRRELAQLRQALQDLDKFLRSENIRFKQTSALYSGARECGEKLQVLQDKLEKIGAGNRLQKVLGRIKWPLDEKGTRQTLEDLQRYTQLFQFAMNIESW